MWVLAQRVKPTALDVAAAAHVRFRGPRCCLLAELRARQFLHDMRIMQWAATDRMICTPRNSMGTSNLRWSGKEGLFIVVS